LFYCKHRLLSPLLDTGVEGYSFDGDGIRSLRPHRSTPHSLRRRFGGIRIILDLTKELERLQAGSEPDGRTEPDGRISLKVDVSD